MAQALPALGALDSMLHQLAAAAGMEMQSLLQLAGTAPGQLDGGSGAAAKREGSPAILSSSPTLLPLAAAMLSAEPQVGC